MKIYKVERTDSWSYDDYDSFVCYANNEDEARRLSPSDYYVYEDGKWRFDYADKTFKYADNWSWVKADKIDTLMVTLLGFTDMPTEGVKPSVILASYNAG